MPNRCKLTTMTTDDGNIITVEADVYAPLGKVWECFTRPEHVMQWNSASSEWHTPKADNDLRVGGKFLYRMEAKDGSVGFDFTGVYDDVKEHKLISYSIADGRKVEVRFLQNIESVKVTESFEAENTNPAKLQKTGWQTILNNFKTYTEQTF